MRIAICGDEADQREVMLSFVCQYNPTLAIDTYDAAIDLLLAVEKIPYDIVFMDIEMPAPNGFEIAQQLKVKSNSPLVIFVTRVTPIPFRAMALLSVTLPSQFHMRCFHPSSPWH